MPWDQLSDEELLARSRAETDLAVRDEYVNEVFRRHYRRVARWCLRFVANREAAADLTQEIFIKAYRNLHSFRGECKFSTWLFTIARNRCFKALRTQTVQEVTLDNDKEADESFPRLLSARASDPQSLMEREADAGLLADLFGRLDETEKQVFALHYAEDLPLQAITRLLGLQNASGAKAYIVSARRKLARLVQRLQAQQRKMTS